MEQQIKEERKSRLGRARRSMNQDGINRTTTIHESRRHQSDDTSIETIFSDESPLW
uniref:Uncharacterized protein n=1 Tax=Oryza sativa subsp. japonica TaxID=39947 RepID=Q6K2H8_ORYSJ|nr:hypothetical protein [Oryza sativa Japonica Group]BAD23638.1 hypothetical protein [Oryza sativa Japonica Group]